MHSEYFTEERRVLTKDGDRFDRRTLFSKISALRNHPDAVRSRQEIKRLHGEANRFQEILNRHPNHPNANAWRRAMNNRRDRVIGLTQHERAYRNQRLGLLNKMAKKRAKDRLREHLELDESVNRKKILTKDGRVSLRTGFGRSLKAKKKYNALANYARERFVKGLAASYYDPMSSTPHDFKLANRRLRYHENVIKNILNTAAKYKKERLQRAQKYLNQRRKRSLSSVVNEWLDYLDLLNEVRVLNKDGSLSRRTRLGQANMDRQVYRSSLNNMGRLGRIHRSLPSLRRKNLEKIMDRSWQKFGNSHRNRVNRLRRYFGNERFMNMMNSYRSGGYNTGR